VAGNWRTQAPCYRRGLRDQVQTISQAEYDRIEPHFSIAKYDGVIVRPARAIVTDGRPFAPRTKSLAVRPFASCGTLKSTTHRRCESRTCATTSARACRGPLIVAPVVAARAWPIACVIPLAATIRPWKPGMRTFGLMRTLIVPSRMAARSRTGWQTATAALVPYHETHTDAAPAGPPIGGCSAR
jgi:hypothetical protein